MRRGDTAISVRWLVRSMFFLLALSATVSSRLILHAQVSASISSMSPAEAVSESPVFFQAELRFGETVERVYFVYRPFTESNWTRVEMQLFGNTASIKIPAEQVTPPFLEYYLVLVKRDGTMESYPVSETTDPLSRPPGKTLQLPVVKKEEDQQAVFLSPEPNASFAPEDVLISVSLFRADTIVVRRATQLLLDGADVSQYVVWSDDILVYVPANHGITLVPGRHKVTVMLYNRQGLLHRQVTTYFNVVAEGTDTKTPSALFLYNGSVDVEIRHENVNRTGTWYNRGNFRFNGSQRDWRFAANAFITSDERSDRQPQNRYYASLESNWLLVGYGDSYPFFPNLILNGKRVRGLNSALRLGKFNLELAVGKTVRDVEGTLIKTIPVNDLGAEQAADPFAAYARIDTVTWGKYNYGTYARNLFAIRPSFGSGEKYQIGFTWLKAKDDVNSIRYGTRPQENLVIGTDLLSRFDEGRIELTGEFAFSAFNGDISSGNFTDAYIDSVYTKDAAAIKNARDILKNFITVNDNLRPLSFKKLSTIAYNAGLALNYFENSFKIAYLYRGSDYNSFGQTFLRKDIAGVNLTDRIKLAPQRLFITLGYERLHDNTSDSKAATTYFNTYNIAVNYDAGAMFPAAVVGYTHYRNYNDLLSNGPDSLNAAVSAVDDQTNRFFVLLTQRFEYHASHSASVSVSSSQRKDYSPRNLGLKNLSISLSVTTRYTIPLQTTVGYTNNTNDFPLSTLTRTELNYSNIFVSGMYTVPRNLGILSCTLSPTFGDLSRFTVDFSAQWNVAPAMNILLQYSLFNNAGLPNDDFWSLKYRYDF